MGNEQSLAVQKIAFGVVKEIENDIIIDSAWKLSDSKLIMSLIVAYSLIDSRDVEFEEFLNVGNEVKMGYKRNSYDGWLFGKCSIDSSLGLLALEGQNWMGIVDIVRKKTIFQVKRDAPRHPWYGRNTHAWITIHGEKYVSVQMNKTEIKMFKVKKNMYTNVFVTSRFKFVEDAAYAIKVKGNTINYCSFDKEFKSLVLLIDNTRIQKRSVPDVKTITAEIQLKEPVVQSSFNQLSFTSDGRLCALGGGASKPYFYVIDIENQKQFKLLSKVLSDTYAPCFVNGEGKYISVGDKQGRVEVWDFELQQALVLIDIGVKKWMPASASIYNVLAIGCYDGKLRLYDTKNWECFYEKECDVNPGSIHLSTDMKYLTIAGLSGSGCSVLKIQPKSL